MTTVPIGGNQFWCGNCMRFFSSPSNLHRHRNQTKDACRFNDNKVTPRKIVDASTGQLRYRTPYEQHELARTRKSKQYWNAQSLERTRAMRRERYRAQFRRNVKKTDSNPKGKRTNNSGVPSVRARQRCWAPLLREAKTRWSEDEVQEQARLLAAYHKVGSMRVPNWVKSDVYAYLEQKHQQPWVFLDIDMDTEDSDEESTSNSDSGSDSDGLENE